MRRTKLIIIGICILVAIAVIYGIARSKKQDEKQTAGETQQEAPLAHDFKNKKLGLSFSYPKLWITEKHERGTTDDGRPTLQVLLTKGGASLILLGNVGDPDLSLWDVPVARGQVRIGNPTNPEQPLGDWTRFESSHKDLAGVETYLLPFDQEANHYLLLLSYPAPEFKEMAQLFFDIVASFSFTE